MPNIDKKLVTISPEHKLVYYVVPKAASTSIRYALTGSDLNTDQRAVAKLTEPYYTFTSIRDPWDRLVSVWANARDRAGTRPVVMGRLLRDMELPDRCSFKKFALRACEIGDHHCNIHYRSQHLLFPATIDRILRFETIGDDWQRLQTAYPTLPDLEWHETSSHEYYPTYYTPELAETVYQRYREDIEKFGWIMPSLGI